MVSMALDQNDNLGKTIHLTMEHMDIHFGTSHTTREMMLLKRLQAVSGCKGLSSKFCNSSSSNVISIEKFSHKFPFLIKEGITKKFKDKANIFHEF